MPAAPIDVKALFFAAADKATPAERAAYLDEACAGDAALRQRVEALLRANDEPGAFLAGPALGAAAAAARDVPGAGGPNATAGFNPSPDLTGAIIAGRYKLLQEIGEGGMGVVYMAEQEKPVRRRVALKIIKPGMDSAQVVARFEAERQALAMMDHQNIARVLDAGTTDGDPGRMSAGSTPGADATRFAAGRPYFVMELVHGIPITKFCDENRLTSRERLELFVPVCQAIQHAHQKGIIHRDIKPSNVLVTLYDDKPVPKVIDFGVAKAVENRLTERTMFTQFGTMVGTFEYMSPEQAAMNAFGVDTRSDIYSLGVLLYELLTGTTPLSRKRLKEAAFDELLRLIKEEEPPKPSTRLSTSDVLASVAAARKTEPAKLSRQVRGEVDWIVMKCLEKDRTRRYETANGLARDIQRYLADEAVEACPPSARYKLTKFARKHRAGLTAAATFAALLIACVAVSTWQAVRATNAERQARAAEVEATDERDRAVAADERTQEEARKALTEAAIARAVNDFLQNDLLAQANPELEPDRDLKLRTLLDRAAQSIEGKFNQQPLVEASIRQTIGSTYMALSLWAAAQLHLERALELHLRHRGEEHSLTLDSMSSLASTLREQGNKNAEAESLYRKALTIRCRLLGEDNPATAGTMHNLAILLYSQGKLADAELLWRKVLAFRQHVHGKEHPATIDSMARIANVQQQQGKLTMAEAEAAARKVLEARRRVQGPAHPDTLLAVFHLAFRLIEQGKLDEAERLCREGLETARRVLGEEHLRTLILNSALGEAHHSRGDYAAAEPLFVRNLEAYRRLQGEGYHLTVMTVLQLAELYKNQGKYDQAEQLALSAVAVSRRVRGEVHPQTLWAMLVLSEVYQRQGKFDQAEPLLVMRVEICRRERGAEHPELALTLASLGSCRLQQQRFAESEPVLRECLTIFDQRVPDGWGRSNAQSLLGGSLLGQKKYAEAEPLLLAGYEGLKQHEATIPVQVRKVRLTEAVEWLVQLYEATGKPDEAAKWRKELEAVKAASKPPARP